MTDYWKSTPTHWCEVCRVWIKDIQKNVENHERSARHQERLTQKIAKQRRDAEKEATKVAKLSMLMHDIESKAVASYAIDLQELGKIKTPLPIETKQSKPAISEKKKINVELPSHPPDAIGEHKVSQIRKLGIQKGGIRKNKASANKVRAFKVDEAAEAKAQRLRREAQERVKKREKQNFGFLS